MTMVVAMEIKMTMAMMTMMTACPILPEDENEYDNDVDDNEN